MILACGHPLPAVASSDLEMHYAFASHSRVAGICRACLRLATATRFESDVRIQRYSACFLKIAKCPRIAIALMQLGVNSKGVYTKNASSTSYDAYVGVRCGMPRNNAPRDAV